MNIEERYCEGIKFFLGDEIYSNFIKNINDQIFMCQRLLVDQKIYFFFFLGQSCIIFFRFYCKEMWLFG